MSVPFVQNIVCATGLCSLATWRQYCTYSVEPSQQCESFQPTKRRRTNMKNNWNESMFICSHTATDTAVVYDPKCNMVRSSSTSRSAEMRSHFTDWSQRWSWTTDVEDVMTHILETINVRQSVHQPSTKANIWIKWAWLINLNQCITMCSRAAHTVIMSKSERIASVFIRVSQQWHRIK